jgi:hypothetical protein
MMRKPINMLYKYEGRGLGRNTPTRHHVKTLAATSSSRPNPETLVACEVLVHPRAVSHPCTCGLHGGTTAVAAMLISYNDMEVAARTDTRRR